MMDLPFTVAILLEHATDKFHFLWETFLVADGPDPMYKSREHGLLIGQVVM
jgi:hypothetical protein